MAAQICFTPFPVYITTHLLRYITSLLNTTLFGLVLLQCFLLSLGFLLVMKTLEYEWYVL